MLKTATCGELRLQNVGQTVTCAGWVHRRRDHGGLVFIDVRDHFGLTQVVFNPAVSATAHEIASGLKPEYVVQVTGVVGARPAGQENPGLPTGAIEVVADHELLKAVPHLEWNALVNAATTSREAHDTNAIGDRRVE